MAIVAVLGYFLPKAKGTRDIDLYTALRDDARSDEERQELDKLRARLFGEIKRSNSSLSVPEAIILIAIFVGLVRCVLGFAASIFLLVADGSNGGYLEGAFEWLIMTILTVLLVYCVWTYRLD